MKSGHVYLLGDFTSLCKVLAGPLTPEWNMMEDPEPRPIRI